MAKRRAKEPRVCVVCSTEKPADQFFRSPHLPPDVCKGCVYAYCDEWREAVLASKEWKD